MPLQQALEVARECNFDLVEVAGTAVPPVCRILDYGKYKYEQAKKEREARKSQKTALLREVRLRPKISAHDLESKVRLVKRLLHEGDKVKVSVIFRGREITHSEIGKDIMQKVLDSLEGVAVVERPLAIDGRTMSLIFLPASSKRPKESKLEGSQSAKA